MELKILKPRKAINKAFLKIKPNRTEIESFKSNLIEILDRTNDTESEEFHKNLVSDFLKNTYYKDNHFINTKGRNDLVIHNGNKAKSTVGVIIEAKKPTNKAEMLTKKKINVKAFQELVLYYLRERITHKNLEVKHLVATNINEWFIFDSNVFEKQFAQNKGLVKQFNDFENGRLAGKTTDFFYKEIAEPFINGLKNDIEFTFFDIREYEKPLRNDNPKDDNKLISLFKLLSPEHLLKLPFANDSNSLDKRFYGELLHIIGLSETKDGSKKLIERNKKGERNTGSFLENAIIQLDSLDKINRLDNPSHFGTTQEARLFNVGLELSITWINRILFLKLLEAQLKTYHKGDKSYEFLSIDKIQNYDDLNSLFFQVLAKQQPERNEDVKELFAKVPYLNSSLFEPTGIEHGTLFISNLRDDKTIPIYSSTVLKNEIGKKRTGNLSTLEYLFEFLNAYDFSSEGKEEIQEDNKTLINASVLGLIFEKINGYKDGSFFTPGFITMYMCRETIRESVIQKFNETKDWNCKDIDSLYNNIEDRQEANNIINSLKICDPAVGSGHFLVSALNEMIAIKNDLKVLQDRDGKRLKEYQFEVVNDELIVTDEDGELFEYNPTNKESQRIQEALFHEKQIIIENCLFGVDINPNSVKICRLRLWIELLKNAYYKNESELETLPNIDINIKCGNSLISRFELDSDLKKALKSSKWTIESYRLAVDTYRKAHNKEQKREMEKLIADIKKDFRSEISSNDKKVKRLAKLKSEIFLMTEHPKMFELPKKEKTAWNKKLKKLTDESKKIETKIEEIKNNKIFEEAFEWRFEFPEILDDNGDFVGFDAIIGNPPYIDSRENIINEKAYWKIKYDSAKYGKTNTYEVFVELGINLLKEKGYISYIIPIVWLSLDACKGSRQAIFKQNQIIKFAFTEDSVFEDANVDTLVFVIKKNKPSSNYEIVKFDSEFNQILNLSNHNQNNLDGLYSINLESNKILENVISKKLNIGSLDNIVSIYNGIATGPGKEKYFSETKLDESYKPLLMGNDVHKYYYDKSTIWINYDRKKLHRARNEEIFLNKEKIVMQRIRNLKLDERIIATIDYNQHYTFNSVNNLLLNNETYDLRYVLGVLNSKLFNYLYKSISKNTNITAQDLNKVPFRLIDFKDDIELKIYDLIIEKVTTLLNETEAEIRLDSKLIELDNLVYELYGITEDEIEIIEEANA
ncbi:BREX-1 system adenine-specific DNA-methyltransferase PglX [Flavobacteriaceae bacterium TK19130]|nr:BREX-1 system adenine-specific DNA-methyltransferase PglX [Thermobacterium salinum]